MGPVLALHAHAAWVVGVVVGAAAFIAAAQQLWKVVRAVVHTHDRVQRVLETSERIEMEFRNNGGSSMRDAIDRVQDSVEVLRVEKDAAHEALWAAIAETRR